MKYFCLLSFASNTTVIMSIIANWHLQIIKSCIDPKVQDNEQNFKTVLVDE